jgi:NAD(P)-dependent dehydrogenase (short-subunit alcohol dehydrogenase family)
MDLGLTGKVCVVTGATRGVGLEVARRLCAEGARTLFVGRNAEALAEAAAAEGFRSLREEANDLVRAGETTADEVERVLAEVPA